MGTSYDSNHQPLPQLTMSQLEYLVEIERQETWGEAARHLGVSSSALSQGISQLENRLGVSLFAKAGRNRVLTADGKQVLQYAQRVVAQTRDLAQWASRVAAGSGGVLRVGMIDLAAVALFGEDLQSFRAHRPDLDFHLEVAPSAILQEKVETGRLDLAVVVQPPINTGDLAFAPLWRDGLAVYAPQGEVAQSPQEWGPWVTFQAGSHTRDLVQQRLAQLGAPFRVVGESNQPEVLREMVMLGMGWTVLPVLQAEVDPNPLVRFVDQAILTRELVIAQRHDRIDNPAAVALARRLQESAAAQGGGRLTPPAP